MNLVVKCTAIGCKQFYEPWISRMYLLAWESESTKTWRSQLQRISSIKWMLIGVDPFWNVSHNACYHVNLNRNNATTKSSSFHLIQDWKTKLEKFSAKW